MFNDMKIEVDKNQENPWKALGISSDRAKIIFKIAEDVEKRITRDVKAPTSVFVVQEIWSHPDISHQEKVAMTYIMGAFENSKSNPIMQILKNIGE